MEATVAGLMLQVPPLVPSVSVVLPPMQAVVVPVMWAGDGLTVMLCIT